MTSYVGYVLISGATIASPGPGIVMTLGNTVNHGLRRAMPGILGIAAGMGVLAAFAASSVGLLLSRVPVALVAVKVAGAAYLVYLGIRLLTSRTSAELASGASGADTGAGRLFARGFLITLANPKPIAFFMALFPQFVLTGRGYLGQFAVLAATFCVLVVLIHGIYGVAALAARTRIGSGAALVKINKVGGGVFIVFAALLLYSAIA